MPNDSRLDNPPPSFHGDISLISSRRLIAQLLMAQAAGVPSETLRIRGLRLDDLRAELRRRSRLGVGVER